LARRWAADRRYGASIEWVANSFRQSFCHGPDPVEEAEPTPRKTVKRVAVVEKLPPAANLGGPSEAEARPLPETKHAPVRTIWTAADGPTQTATASEGAEPAADVAPEPTRPPVLPARKPVIETLAPAAQVVSEQTIQTGEETPPPAEAAVAQVPPPAVAEREPLPPGAAAAQPTAETPRAFAFAAAMNSARPSANGQPKTADASTCRVTTASYGGKKILLVRSKDSPEVSFTVLTVLEGFEKSMLDNYLKAHAPGGSSVGEFASRTAAFAKARQLCPSAAGTPSDEGASAG
jgi:hypothetical protein